MKSLIIWGGLLAIACFSSCIATKKPATPKPVFSFVNDAYLVGLRDSCFSTWGLLPLLPIDTIYEVYPKQGSSGPHLRLGLRGDSTMQRRYSPTYGEAIHMVINPQCLLGQPIDRALAELRHLCHGCNFPNDYELKGGFNMDIDAVDWRFGRPGLLYYFRTYIYVKDGIIRDAGLLPM